MVEKHVKEIVLLSPIGITVKEEDYKSQVRGVSDFFYGLFVRIGWAFKLTYPFLMRTICCCCKNYFVDKYLSET